MVACLLCLPTGTSTYHDTAFLNYSIPRLRAAGEMQSRSSRCMRAAAKSHQDGATHERRTARHSSGRQTRKSHHQNPFLTTPLLSTWRHSHHGKLRCVLWVDFARSIPLFRYKKSRQNKGPVPILPYLCLPGSARVSSLRGCTTCSVDTSLKAYDAAGFSLLDSIEQFIVD